MICRYIALFVSDLRSAESFYGDVFDMTLLFREGTRDERQYLLPHGSDWDTLARQAITIDMLALRRDEFVIALFPGSPRPGTVLEIGIGLEPGEIEPVRARVPPALIRDHEEGLLQFDDPFGVRWTVEEVGSAFVSVLPDLPA